MITRRLAVSDMQCVGCAGRVRTILMNIRGVVKVITSLDDHTAEVTFDEHATNSTELEGALKSGGFNSPEGKCC